MHITPSETNEIREVAEVAREDSPASGAPKTTKRVTAALIFLPISLAIIMTGFGIIIPVFPQRLDALGLGAETLALMEGAFGLGTFLFSTPMGVLANRFGRKPLVLLALIGFIVTNLLLAYVNGAVFFIIIRFLEGALVAGFMPASMAMVGDVIPPERQGRWMGMMTTAQAGGIALGPAIGGVLYQSWGFTSPFLLSAGFALVASLLALFMLPETLPQQVREQAMQRKLKKQSGEKVRDANTPSLLMLTLLFAPMLLLDLGAAFIYPFSLPQYPFFFETTLHYTPSQYGLIISMYGLALAVFPLVLGRVSEMLPKKLVIIVGCLLSSALNLAMLWLHAYPLLIAASIITGVGSALLIPALSTIYLNASDDQNRAQIMGIRSTTLSLAMLLAPLSQAAAGPWITPEITFAISGGLSVVMMLVAIVAVRSPKKAPQNEHNALA